TLWPGDFAQPELRQFFGINPPTEWVVAEKVTYLRGMYRRRDRQITNRLYRAQVRIRQGLGRRLPKTHFFAQPHVQPRAMCLLLSTPSPDLRVRGWADKSCLSER